MISFQTRALRTSVLGSVAVGASTLLASMAMAMHHEALAPLQINSASSSLTFTTTKSSAAGVGGLTETMQFTRYEGGLDAQGRMALKIDLTSIDSGISIRDDRLQSLFWNVGQYPSVSFAAQLSPEVLHQLAKEPTVVEVDGQLTMGGQTNALKAQLQVTPVAGKVLVSTRRPILVSAADFGLTGGAEALRVIMGLNYLSSTVPVTFQLELTPKR